jgi:hypothetical protein
MDYSRLSVPARRQRSGPPPFAVGERAVVQYERARMAGVDVVLLTDESGATTLRALPDGQEVEMVAWRLAWRNGPRMLYQVSCLGDGALGWVQAEFLRALPAASRGAVTAAVNPDRRRRRPTIEPQPSVAAEAEAEMAAAPPGVADRPVACPVCGERVHPYNLWSDSNKRTIGCYLCRGKTT